MCVAALTLRVSALEDRLLLLVQEMEDRWDLRAAAGEWRSLHLRGDESPDGQEVGSHMRLFGQFQKMDSRNFVCNILHRPAGSGVANVLSAYSCQTPGPTCCGSE